jgi:hypothetical protein
MAMEPINIFSRRVDVRGVLALLRSLAPDIEVAGPEDCWKKIVVSGPKQWFKRPTTLTFTHDPNYYDGPDWPRQRMGMQGYFANFAETARKPAILRLIDTFCFSLATDWQPDLASEKDERLAYLYAVVQHLDGVLFTPSSLRDAQGRVLISADGSFDSDAILPGMPAEKATDGVDDEEPLPQPPTAARVARRALVLTAIGSRACLEEEDPSEEWVQRSHGDTLAWVDAIDIGDEIEPDEWEVLQRPPGRLEQRAMIDSTWRLEGLAVLAWALGRFDMPAYDQLVAAQDLVYALGFLNVELAREILANAHLRPPAELEICCKQMLGLHWRLRDYTLRPQAMDFRAFAQNCWFGTFDLGPFRLINDDLALGDHPIHDAPEDVFRAALSAPPNGTWPSTG